MSILNLMNYFRKNKSAEIARNRLHIIIAQEKSQKNSPDYLPMLRQEILKVVAKYTNANIDQVNVELHRKDNNAILELNVTLPDSVVT
ncbi:MAG: cell division topological specificity factor MinE [uncultured bacterium]|nr:MAG: cell division topological specificity factor MinE [uncultured bacterium]OGT33903.1 MAG: cell division topological specificity factor MinE [Gammaproteobacteria bacterium RIFCSPHIGHO2_02_FULL_39_13]OGT50154.1 MAG: cell division topological specificity factor MinE [Gammaproteobacteria bacterium RIFCSPHIGHO2_12_FULL_39_24]